MFPFDFCVFPQFQVAPAASGLVFDSSAPSASAVTESSSVVNGLDEFFGSSAPAVPALSAGEVLAADFTTAAPANTNAFFPLDDNAVPGTPAANVAVDDDPFFQHYFPPAPSAPATVPEVVDPRVEWRKHNNELVRFHTIFLLSRLVTRTWLVWALTLTARPKVHFPCECHLALSFPSYNLDVACGGRP